MNSKLQTLFEDLERQRLQLLNEVKQQPEKFDLKPDKKKWSIREILAHLVTAEKLTVQYIAKKIQGIDQAGDSGLLEEIKMIILKISQRLPLKFIAPSAVIVATPSYASLDQLTSDWDIARSNFKQLLERVRDDQLKRKIYKHIITGRLNIVHAILFSREHITHHLPQINRILKS